jgi:hypothetical protein
MGEVPQEIRPEKVDAAGQNRKDPARLVQYGGGEHHDRMTMFQGGGKGSGDERLAGFPGFLNVFPVRKVCPGSARLVGGLGNKVAIGTEQQDVVFENQPGGMPRDKIAFSGFRVMDQRTGKLLRMTDQGVPGLGQFVIDLRRSPGYQLELLGPQRLLELPGVIADHAVVNRRRQDKKNRQQVEDHLGFQAHCFHLYVPFALEVIAILIGRAAVNMSNLCGNQLVKTSFTTETQRTQRKTRTKTSIRLVVLP